MNEGNIYTIYTKARTIFTKEKERTVAMVLERQLKE